MPRPLRNKARHLVASVRHRKKRVGEKMIEDGKMVVVNYTGTLSDGTVFDTSEGIEPLEFRIGSGTVIRGFEEAVKEMEPGDVVTVEIPPEKAFGFRDEDKIFVQPMLSLPDPRQYEVGKSYIINREGMIVHTKLLEIDAMGNGHFDFNLPLADETLTFRIELLEVK